MTKQVRIPAGTLGYFKGDDLAASVWYSKYRTGNEITPDDMFDRHASVITSKLIDRLTGSRDFKDSETFSKLSPTGREIIGNMCDLVNSGEEGRLKFFNMVRDFVNFDNMVPGGSMMQGLGNTGLFTSLSNCFVAGQPHDSYAGINKKTSEITELMKRRGGAGLDLSTIRPRGSRVNNQSGTSSGPCLFANRYSNITLEVAQEGRRGALMLTLDIKHPDAREFITMKQDKTKVTGANISVKIGDDFMNAVVNNQTYYHVFPCDVKVDTSNTGFQDVMNKPHGELVVFYPSEDYLHDVPEGCKAVYVRPVNARELWDTIIQCAWNTAEPGIIFPGNWERGGTDYHYPRYRPVSTNPCSEIPMQAYDSCRLYAVNMYKLVDNPFTPGSTLSMERSRRNFYLQAFIGDVIIDIEVEHINNIINKVKTSSDPVDLVDSEVKLWENVLRETISGRRMGCGFLGMADMLAALGEKYSSVDTIKTIFKAKLESELDATVDMSMMFGMFCGFDPSLEREESNKEGTFLNMLSNNFRPKFERMMEHGRRNVSWSTGAPTGSLSLMTQTTPGIEPLFLPYFERRKKCILATDRVDYIDPNDGQKFTVFLGFHVPFIDWAIMTHGVNPREISRKEVDELFTRSPWYGQLAADLSIEERVNVQSVVQSHTTHAISSTINLPADVKPSIISDIYMESWKAGLKGNTVYREGSRGGVIVKTGSNLDTSTGKGRPINLDARYYRYKDKVVIIGLDSNNKPYEIFILSAEDINAPIIFNTYDYIDGYITKESSNFYSFTATTFDIPDLESIQNGDKQLSLLLSQILRHGIPIVKVVKNIDKCEPISGSFSYFLKKVLTTFIENGTESGEKCPSCGGKIAYQDGCNTCLSCGLSTKC
jgi:ribonucleoside-diphosphate reductase alpha chain